MKIVPYISSSAFDHNGIIPIKYTADGENHNPPLFFGGINEHAKSLVLIVDDPDAVTDPLGSGAVYTHWVVFNIPPDTADIVEDSVPAGATVGKNSIGTNEYIGPAPPTGAHRYFFRLFELSDQLPLDENATKEEVLEAIKPVLIDRAEIIGLYRRSH